VKALSIRQPWADAIMAGWKTVENRTWEPTHRGDLALHTGLTVARLPHDLGGPKGEHDYLSMLDRQLAVASTAPGDRVVGHVVGVVQLVSVHTADQCVAAIAQATGNPDSRDMCSPFSLPNPGPYAKRASADMFHWVLADPRPIDPVMVSGSLQLFTVDLPD
jgi:hypothetical protein